MHLQYDRKVSSSRFWLLQVFWASQFSLTFPWLLAPPWTFKTYSIIFVNIFNVCFSSLIKFLLPFGSHTNYTCSWHFVIYDLSMTFALLLIIGEVQKCISDQFHVSLSFKLTSNPLNLHLLSDLSFSSVILCTTAKMSSFKVAWESCFQVFYPLVYLSQSTNISQSWFKPII